MVQFNLTQKEAIYKIIYYGPKGSGKKTNLRYIQENAVLANDFPLITIAVGNTNLSVNMMTLPVGKIDDVNTRFLLFSIPGEENSNSALKTFLQDADGVIFIADSVHEEENLSAWQSLQTLSRSLHLNIMDNIVIQWNKRDVPNALPLKKLQSTMNINNHPDFAASALTGEGVFSTLETLCDMLIEKSAKKYPSQWSISPPKRGKTIKFARPTASRNKKSAPEVPEATSALPPVHQKRQEEEKSLEEQDVIKEEIKEEIRSCPAGEVAFFNLSGQITQKNGQALRNRIEVYLLEKNCMMFILDLQEVDHFHSTVFGMLIEMANKVRMRGGGIRLVHTKEKFKNLFSMMGMESFLPTFANTNEALNSFSFAKKEIRSFEKKPVFMPDRMAATQVRRYSEAKTTTAKSSRQKIFFLYHQKNESFALSSIEKIKDQNLAIWSSCAIDKDIDSIVRGIRECDIFVFLWSSEVSPNSIFIEAWVIARNLTKAITALSLENSPPLPFLISQCPSLTINSETDVTKILSHLHSDIPTANPLSLLPHLSRVPWMRSSFYQAKERLFEVYKKIKTNRVLCISQPKDNDIQGYGKTQLAREFLFRYGFCFSDGIIWADGGENWQENIIQEAYKLGVFSKNQKTFEDSWKDFLNYCLSSPNLIVVLDDFSNLTDLPEELRSIYVLMTTKSLNISTGIAKVVAHEIMPRVAHQYIQEDFALDNPSEESAARELLEKTHYLPFSFRILYGLAKKKISFCKLLETMPEDLDSVRAILHFFLEKGWSTLVLPESKRIFNILGFLPKGFSIEARTLGILLNLSFDEQRIKDAIDELDALGFLEKELEGKIFLHSEMQIFSTLLYRNGNEEKEQRKQVWRKLSSCFQDIAKLDNECKTRGLDSILSDLALVVAWQKGENEPVYFEELLQILQEEALVLRKTQIYPLFFVQQIYSRIKGRYSEDHPLLQSFDNSLGHISWSKGCFWLKRVNSSPAFHDKPKKESIVRFSSDAKEIIVGNLDSLNIYDHKEHTQKNIIPFWAQITSLEYSPQQDYLAVNQGNILQIRDRQGKLLHQNQKHEDWILAFAFSSDGELLLSGGIDRVIRMWETKTGDELRTFKGHLGGIRSLSFFSREASILSGSIDHTIKLWNIETGKETQTFRGHESIVTALYGTFDGQHFISGSELGCIKIWSVDEGKEVQTLSGHDSAVHSLDLSPDQRYLISTAEDGYLNIWDMQTAKLIHRFYSPHPLGQCGFCQKGSQIWTCAQTSEPTLYQFEFIAIRR